MKELSGSVRAARMRFLDAVEPHRPGLYRYCRSLAPTVWDAEDLLQDTLLKAFSKLGEVHFELKTPRAWLFRIATTTWIDRTRKKVPVQVAAPEVASPADPRELTPEVREALEQLSRRLPPQERTAVLLKDVFGLSLSEVARALDTTRGAVKAALHRGRGKLGELQAAGGATSVSPPPPGSWGPPPELLDRFVEAFNARDLDRLTGLFQDDAEAEVVGMVHELGRDQIRDGSLHHTLFDEHGDPRIERVELLGERLLAIRYTREVDGVRVTEVGDILRLFAGDDGLLRTLRYYYFCPEVLEEVTSALGLPVHTNGYRYQPKP